MLILKIKKENKKHRTLFGRKDKEEKKEDKKDKKEGEVITKERIPFFGMTYKNMVKNMKLNIFQILLKK